MYIDIATPGTVSILEAEDSALTQYYRISPKIWEHAREHEWDDDSLILAFYLLTGPHRRTEGLYRLPKEYICADLGWSPQRLGKPFGKLMAEGFIHYDESARVILVTNALSYQRPENENQRIAAKRSLEQLPTHSLWCLFARSLEQFANDFGDWLRQRLPQHIAEQFDEPFAKPFGEPLPQPFEEPLAERFKERLPYTPSPSPSPSPNTRAATKNAEVYPASFSTFWETYPRKANKKGAYDRYKARLRIDATEDALQTAAVNYAAYCTERGTQEEFIMHATTFLGPQQRWQEWRERRAVPRPPQPYAVIDEFRDD